MHYIYNAYAEIFILFIIYIIKRTLYIGIVYVMYI